MISVGFGVLIAVVMKRSIFWDTMPCSPLKVSWCFAGTCHLYSIFRVKKYTKQGTSKKVGGLLFDSENGGNTFLRNIDQLSTDYMAVYPSNSSLNDRWLLVVFITVYLVQFQECLSGHFKFCHITSYTVLNVFSWVIMELVKNYLA
jgi:hypothetical protein